MKLFVAGECQGRDEETWCRAGLRNRLVTFAYKRGSPMKWWVTERSTHKPLPESCDVFLDCGAFSAHAQGLHIDVHEYSEFIKRHQVSIDRYAALDVIGNMHETKTNTEIMENEYGLSPMPTFHRGSKWTELKRLCEQYHAFALGGIASEHVGQRVLRKWLDGCFAIIQKAWPKRVHGFGIASQWALERYPFFSTDSTNVIIGGGLGRVMRWNKGKLGTSHWTQDSRDNLERSVMDTQLNGSAYVQRIRSNCEAQVLFEKYITDVWMNRGVKWDG